MTVKKPFYTPRRTRKVPAKAWVEYPGPIPKSWCVIAKAKGYRIDRRIRDRYHIVLECLLCGAHTVQRAFTLRTALPACGGCRLAKHRDNAVKVGFVLIDQDEAPRGYANYRLPCGHTTLLQRGRVQILAQKGAVPGRAGYHCVVCYTEKLQQAASSWGWSVVGVDPDGSTSYRLLEHVGCGHRQRVAISNIETGRFGCGGCGESWVSAPSWLYMLRFNVPGLGRLVKLGYSRNPESRLRYQLGLRHDIEAELIHKLRMPSGQIAQRFEKNLHRKLKTDHPCSVVLRTKLTGWINVTSEIYSAQAESIIRRMVDDVEKPAGSVKPSRTDRYRD